MKKLKTYSVRKRKSLVNVNQFVRLNNPPRDFKGFLRGLPDLLAGRDFNRLVSAIIRAYKGKRLVVAAIGAHVIKCGLSPVIIDLMKRGIIDAVAMSGAVAIHDYEISLIGKTSEDVKENIKKGKFGMAKEPAEFFARASEKSIYSSYGLGESFGKLILKDKNRYAKHSILAQAAKLGVPATVHVAFGTDTVHMHPCISGSFLGEATLFDFQLLTDIVCKLNKGVWLNIGSAVIMPEVFLKAVSLARNRGYALNDFTAANMDMIQHYRSQLNVTGRPAKHGVNITGHHEIMLPLLRWGILASLKS